MKKQLLVSILLMPFTASLVAQETFDLTVTVNGIPGNKGALEVGLAKTEKQLTGETVEYRVLRRPATTGKNQVTFSNVSAGKYAIYSYHDKNNNRELDKNWRNVPEEAFGFSSPQMQPLEEPKFNELLVDVSPANSKVQVNLVQIN